MCTLVNVTPMSRFGMETGCNHHIMIWVSDDDIIKNDDGKPYTLNDSGWQKVAEEYSQNSIPSYFKEVLILHFYNEIEVNAMIERTENTIKSLTKCLEEAKDCLYRFKNHINFNDKLTKN
jgi:acid phosphatase class B